MEEVNRRSGILKVISSSIDSLRFHLRMSITINPNISTNLLLELFLVMVVTSHWAGIRPWSHCRRNSMVTTGENESYTGVRLVDSLVSVRPACGNSGSENWAKRILVTSGRSSQSSPEGNGFLVATRTSKPRNREWISYILILFA